MPKSPYIYIYKVINLTKDIVQCCAAYTFSQMKHAGQDEQIKFIYIYMNTQQRFRCLALSTSDQYTVYYIIDMSCQQILQ